MNTATCFVTPMRSLPRSVLNTFASSGLALFTCLLLATRLATATAGEIGGSSSGSLRISVHVPTKIRASVLSYEPKQITASPQGQLCLHGEQAHPFKVFLLKKNTQEVSAQRRTKTDAIMTQVGSSDALPACASTYTIASTRASSETGYPYRVLIAPE